MTSRYWRVSSFTCQCTAARAISGSDEDEGPMSLDLPGTGRKRWTMRWKAAVQVFDIAFDRRLTAGRC